MNKEELLNKWLEEEKRVFQGWDFSSIDEYTIEEELPWDYKKAVEKYIDRDLKILDIGTGGGEFLLNLNPFPDMTFATEAYLPNYNFSKDKLSKYGIELRFLENDSEMPFEDGFFDVIISRHESFDAKEINRILKKNGKFITQQVGGKNNYDFAVALTGNDFDSTRDLGYEINQLTSNGFEILSSEEYYPNLKFTDIGAFVYFAKIIEWEFVGFSVKKYLDKLYALHEEVENNGFIEMSEHRFFIESIKI